MGWAKPEMFNFLCSCPCQDEQQLPRPRVRSELAGWGLPSDVRVLRSDDGSVTQRGPSYQVPLHYNNIHLTKHFHFLSQFQFQQASVHLDLQYGSMLL